jgi:hypothetical protein
MRRILVVIVALVPLALATAASAASVRVNAAENMTDSGSRGSCQVHLSVNLDELEAFCFSPGRTWFKVRVPGVEGPIRRVQAAERGDCSGQRIDAVRRGGTNAIVRITNVGEFDCYYTTVVVRFDP